jgi:hypothetical protein
MKVTAHSCENESDELLMLRMAIIGVNFIPDVIADILNITDDRLYEIKKKLCESITKEVL